MRHGKTAVSHFSYNKIGISRITKKLTFFARIINLTIIKYFSQSNALFLILILVICLHALFFGLVNACFQGYCHNNVLAT